MSKERAMSQSSTLSVGLDVHEDSIDIAVAESPREAEIRHVGSIKGDLASLDKALRKLISRGQLLHIVYEARPCGYFHKNGKYRPAKSHLVKRLQFAK